MALDGFDWVAVGGFGGLIAGAVGGFLEPLLLAALLGGFVLSLSVWRFYQGRVWEGLGWLVWVAGAVLLALGIDGNPILILGFVTTMLVGIVFLFGGRFGLLPNVWRVEVENVR